MTGVRFFDRKTGQFYIKQPKLIHIGPITTAVNNNDNNKTLSLKEKKEIKEFADFAEWMGIEFGADTVISISKHNIFKIRDEFINSNLDTKVEECRINEKKEKPINSIDIIKEQLGLYD